MFLRNITAVILGAIVAFQFGVARQTEQDKNEIIEAKVVSTKLPSQVIYQFDRGVGKGRIVKAQQGKDGFVKETFEMKTDGKGRVISKILLGTERVEAVNTIYSMGRMGHETSRSSFSRGKVMTVNSTAYEPSAGRGKSATFKTATGLIAKYGVIAVDRRIIPLNTYVYVEGYGFAIAADTGGAIKGKIIDVCFNTRAECMKWGRRKVQIHILGR